MAAISNWVAAHRKLVVFVVGIAAELATERWGTSNEWVSLGIAIATGLGIYQARNVTVAEAVKEAVAPEPPPPTLPAGPLLPPPPEPPPAKPDLGPMPPRRPGPRGTRLGRFDQA